MTPPMGLITDALAAAPWWLVLTLAGLALAAALATVGLVLRWSARLATATLRGVVRAAAAGPDRRATVGVWLRQRAMTALFAVVVAIVVGLSAQTLVGWLISVGMTPGWARLAFVAFDGMAVMLALTLWRRAERGESTGMIRVAVWALVSAAAWFNSHHAPPGQPAAAVAYAAFPIVAAVGLEVLLQEARRDRSWLRRQRGEEESRRLALVRWLHPVERARVALMLATDERMGAEAATRAVRVHTAARAVHRLRRLPRWAGLLVAAEPRAQRALARAGVDEDHAVLADVLRRVQVLTQAGRIAGLDYSSPAGARAVVGSLITEQSLEPLALPAVPAVPAEGTESATDASTGPQPGRRSGSRRSGPATGPDSNVTAMPARRTDEELEAEGRAVYTTGMTLEEFRHQLRVGQRRAHRVWSRLRDEEATG